jgi:hypothetical protein
MFRFGITAVAFGLVLSACTMPQMTYVEAICRWTARCGWA